MVIRNYTWADLSALLELINLVRKTGGDERVLNISSLKEELAQPGLAPEENCFLFEDDQGLLAYFILHPELRIGRAVLETGIHPDRKENGIEKEVLTSALAQAKAIGARMLHICAPPSEFWGDLLDGEGFSKVRSYWRMRWHRDTVSPVELPQGFSIESFRPGDEERLTWVQNESFNGSWGFCPNTVQEISYRAGMSMCAPEGILFLTHGRETAGYCWTCILGGPQNTIGVIGMIGVASAFRGQGLSRPILLAGMEYLHSRGVKYIELDVDGDNRPATKLYASVGFGKAQEVHWFEAELSES